MSVQVSRRKIRRLAHRTRMNCWVISRDEDMRWVAEFDGEFFISLDADTHEELVEKIRYLLEADPYPDEHGSDSRKYVAVSASTGRR